MSKINRREFLRLSALASAGVAVVACARTAEPTQASQEEPTAAPKAEEPTVAPKAEEPTATPAPQEEAYQESPMLSTKVGAGQLPPLEDRLPGNAVVVGPGVALPEDECDFEVGTFGGTLRSVHNNVGWNPDVFVMCNEPLIWGPGIYGEELTGNVVEGFEVSDESKVFTFSMRKGLKWSDGEPVTSDDVAFAYNDVLMNDKITPTFPAALKSGKKASGTPMQLEVLDTYTFRVSFDQTYGAFLTQLAIVGWYGYTDFIKPKHYLTQFHADYTPLEELAPLIQEEELSEGEWWTLFTTKDHTNWDNTKQTAVGFPYLNPWVMVSTSPVMEQYERNPYYLKVDETGQQLPYIDGIDDRLVENVEGIVMTVLAGEVDFLYEAGAMPSVPVYKDNEEKGGYNTVLLRSHTEPATVYINMTYDDDAWRQVVQDVRFRQALNMSLDRDQIIESVWLGSGAEPPQTTPSEYDPEQANSLLDELGLDQRDSEGFRLGPDGNVFEIPFELANRTPEMVPTAELVVEFFNDIGLKTSMKTIDSGLRSQRRDANELKATVERNNQPLWWSRGEGWCMPGEWGRLWEVWRTSGGEEGEEPPSIVKEYIDLAESILLTVPEERQAVLDAVDKIKYENILYVVPVEKERRPIIASKRMGNVAHEGFSIAACFGGEQLFYKE